MGCDVEGDEEESEEGGMPNNLTLERDCENYGCHVLNHAMPFGLFEGCFGGLGRPTDMDGVVERNGYCLFFEWKEDDAVVKEGQHRLFVNLTKQRHADRDECANVVLVVWHEKGDPTKVLRMAHYQRGEYSLSKEADLAAVQDVCRRWDIIALANGSSA